MILPAYLVGSGLKPTDPQGCLARDAILPAYLVGSGLKRRRPLCQPRRSWNSPGLFSREWIET